MAQRNEHDLLTEDELTAAFLGSELDDFGDEPIVDDPEPQPEEEPEQPTEPTPDEETIDTEFPGQLAVDVYETAEKLIVKARTPGVDKKDLDVSISDGMLTIRGTLSSGDDVEITNFFIQECFWGEFMRTISLPVAVKEDVVEAVLKEGVLTISFEKIKKEDPTIVIEVK